MIKKEGHDASVDIWDIGVLMFELLSGYSPFSGANQQDLFNNIKRHKINWPEDFPSYAQNLISKILKQNPKERISLDNIIAHTWFEKNPCIRPVLVNLENDSKKILESHLVNVNSDNLQKEIDSIIRLRQSRICKTDKKEVTNSPNNNQSSLSNSEISKKIEEAKQELSESHKREMPISNHIKMSF